MDNQCVLAVEVPVRTPEAIAAFYTVLGKNYEWDPAISKYLQETLEIKNVYDFLAAFKTDKDWDN